LEKDLGLKAELLVGKSGQFTVSLDGQKVIEKNLFSFPDEKEIVEAVRKKLAAPAEGR
jgi:hypothetical protein